MPSVLVTGASSGIGKACAAQFHAAGWAVFAAARRADELAELGRQHPGLTPAPLDVTDAFAVDQLVDSICDTAGRLDCVFNNAGVFPPAGDPDEMSTHDWDRAVAVNLSGAFYVARAAFRAMKAQNPKGGRIINNGSISAHVPRPGSIAYTATKHAITGLTRSLSLDGRPHDIACSQIDIGNADTDMVRGLAAAAVGQETHVMDVAHVAQAVLNMASLPLSANVQFMTLMATKMPYIGRG